MIGKKRIFGTEVVEKERSVGLLGCVDSVSVCNVSGWVCDPSGASGVILFLDGIKVAETNVLSFRPDLVDIGNDGRCGFALAFPTATKARQLRLETAGQVWFRGTAPSHQRLFAERALTGYLDTVDHTGLHGWLERVGNGPSSVDIFFDNAYQTTLTADSHREDLVEKSEDPHCGFRMALSYDQLTSTRQIRAVVSGTSIDLSGSPVAIEIEKLFPLGFDNSQVPPLDRALRTNLERLRLDNHSVTVIVPIFNAATEFQCCLENLVANTDYPHEVLLINDASTDPEIAKICEQYVTAFSNFTVLTNSHNEGFTKTVNRGIKHSSGDIVLLNSDTRVTKRWLNELARAAYSSRSIGTVTAVSDDAGEFNAFSRESRPGWMGDDAVARVVRYRSRGVCLDTPTGNGFCLYIKRELIEEIGALDQEAFPRGYGEENDFCVRAQKSGYRNTIQTSALVMHSSSSSFREGRHELVTAGLATLGRLHPEYFAQVSAESPGRQLLPLKSDVDRELSRAPINRPARFARHRVCMVLHADRTGGTWLTVLDFARAIQNSYETFFLLSTGSQIELCQFEKDRLTTLRVVNLVGPLSHLSKRRADYDAVVFQIFTEFGFDLIHVNHLYKHTLAVPEVARLLGVPVVLTVHDFYFVCPTINLLDGEKNYCGGTCTKGAADCELPFKVNGPRLRDDYVHTWRERVRKMLACCDSIVFPDSSAQEIVNTIFPDSSEKTLVIPHGRDFKEQLNLAGAPALVPHKIGLIGDLTEHKGLSFIRRLLELDRDGSLEFHIFGNIDSDEKHDIGVWHGRYERDKLADALRPHGLSAIGIFSVWPETYCHTLSEAFQCGLPVFGTSLGAVGRRLSDAGGGWVLDVSDPEGSYQEILSVMQNLEVWDRGRIRASLESNVRSLTEAAEDWDSLYQAHIYGTHEEVERCSLDPNQCVELFDFCRRHWGRGRVQVRSQGQGAPLAVALKYHVERKETFGTLPIQGSEASANAIGVLTVEALSELKSMGCQLRIVVLEELLPDVSFSVGVGAMFELYNASVRQFYHSIDQCLFLESDLQGKLRATDPHQCASFGIPALVPASAAGEYARAVTYDNMNNALGASD